MPKINPIILIAVAPKMPPQAPGDFRRCVRSIWSQLAIQALSNLRGEQRFRSVTQDPHDVLFVSWHVLILT